MRRGAWILAGAAAVCAGLMACDRGGSPQKQPAPPPPSEQVPNAPGPDNTIKQLPEGQK